MQQVIRPRAHNPSVVDTKSFLHNKKNLLVPNGTRRFFGLGRKSAHLPLAAKVGRKPENYFKSTLVRSFYKTYDVGVVFKIKLTFFTFV